MKKTIRFIEKITIALAAITICGFIYNNIVFEMLRRSIAAGVYFPGYLDGFALYSAILYIISFIFHLSSITLIVLQLKFFKRESILRSFLFFASIISSLMLFGDFALLSDISKEYVFGFPDEFYVLYLSQVFHFIFYACLLAMLTKTAKLYRKPDTEEVVIIDEAIFNNTHYVGILTGISGIIAVAALAAYSELWALRMGIVAISIIMAIPYAAMALYWLIIKLREKTGSHWYDEKQYQDLSRSGLITLGISILLLGTSYGMQFAKINTEMLSLIWFPVFFFFILLLFSGLTLFFNKKA